MHVQARRQNRYQNIANRIPDMLHDISSTRTLLSMLSIVTVNYYVLYTYYLVFLVTYIHGSNLP